MFPDNVAEILRKIFGQHFITLPMSGMGFTGTVVPIYILDARLQFVILVENQTAINHSKKGKYMNRIIIKPSCLAALFIVCIFISLNSHAQSSLTNGLIAYYPFNGNANDASGNGNNGTVSGAVLATDRFGNTNSCYQFNGTSSKILANISNIPTNAQARTLSLWEKFTGNLNAAGTFTPAAWGSNADNEAFGIMAQYGTAPVHWLVQFWGGGEDVDSGVTIDANHTRTHLINA